MVTDCILDIVVHGPPATWSVYTKRGPQTPSHQRLQAWQEAIRAEVLTALAGHGPYCGAIKLWIDFYRPIPIGAPKREPKRSNYLAQRMLKRPDLTNHAKGAEDALSNTLFFDDSQVIHATYTKWYSEEPRTEIRAWSIPRWQGK